MQAHVCCFGLRGLDIDGQEEGQAHEVVEKYDSRVSYIGAWVMWAF